MPEEELNLGIALRDSELKLPPANVDAQAEQEARTWKAKYDGLQGFAKKLKTDHDTNVLDLHSLKSQSEAEKLQLTTDKERLEKELAQYKSQAESSTTELGKLKKQAEVGKLISTKYPDLTTFYHDGLIRDVDNLEGEVLEQYLTTFSDKVKSTVTEKLVKDVQGSTPVPPSQRQPSTTSLSSLVESMETVRRQHGPMSTQYRQASDEYTQFLRNNK